MSRVNGKLKHVDEISIFGYKVIFWPLQTIFMFANVNVSIIIRMKNFLKSKHEKMNMTDKGQTITVTIISRI